MVSLQWNSLGEFWCLWYIDDVIWWFHGDFMVIWWFKWDWMVNFDRIGSWNLHMFDGLPNVVGPCRLFGQSSTRFSNIHVIKQQKVFLFGWFVDQFTVTFLSFCSALHVSFFRQVTQVSGGRWWSSNISQLLSSKGTQRTGTSPCSSWLNHVFQCYPVVGIHLPKKNPGMEWFGAVRS